MSAHSLSLLPFARKVAAPLIALAFALGAGALLVSLFHTNREWLAKVDVPTASSLDADMFKQLSSAGTIWPERTGVSVAIAHTPCNSLTLLSPEGAPLVSGAAGAVGRKDVRELCESPQGERIRQEIANFNRSFLLAGISDNREARSPAEGAPCANGSGKASVFGPTGCLPNQGSGSVAADGRPVHSVATAAISPLEYAFMATSDIGYFGDWKAIAPSIDIASGRSGDHVFRSSVAFGKIPLRIRTIGIVASMTVDGVKLAMPEGRAALARISPRAGLVQVAGVSFCSDDDR